MGVKERDLAVWPAPSLRAGQGDRPSSLDQYSSRIRLREAAPNQSIRNPTSIIAQVVGSGTGSATIDWPRFTSDSPAAMVAVACSVIENGAVSVINLTPSCENESLMPFDPSAKVS